MTKLESMPYIVAANPAMAVFPDVTNIAWTMALNGGLRERSVEFYETVVSNFAVVMGCLIQAGIIRTGGIIHGANQGQTEIPKADSPQAGCEVGALAGSGRPDCAEAEARGTQGASEGDRVPG